MWNWLSFEDYARSRREELLRTAARERLAAQAGAPLLAHEQGAHAESRWYASEVCPEVLARPLVRGARVVVMERFYPERAATSLHAHPGEHAVYVLGRVGCGW